MLLKQIQEHRKKLVRKEIHQPEFLIKELMHLEIDEELYPCDKGVSGNGKT